MTHSDVLFLTWGVYHDNCIVTAPPSNSIVRLCTVNDIYELRKRHRMFNQCLYYISLHQRFMVVETHCAFFLGASGISPTRNFFPSNLTYSCSQIEAAISGTSQALFPCMHAITRLSYCMTDKSSSCISLIELHTSTCLTFRLLKVQSLEYLLWQVGAQRRT